jgi:CheY-like chemotaxis protein
VDEGKGLEFTISLDPKLGAEFIRTDAKRLQQVLKNLLSNALKFTEGGSVQLRMERATKGWSPTQPVLARAKSVVVFSVSDTGIGIPPEKHRIIFEAFQQADGTTSRRYGGTGLGLSISRELARLLGGEIRLESAVGKGSVFSLYLPQVYAMGVPRMDLRPEPPAFTPLPFRAEEPTDWSAGPVEPATHELELESLEDDRQQIRPGDNVFLIVEDDAHFARFLMDLAHDREMKAVVAMQGSTAITLAREFRPAAITLDLRLPDMSGWTLLDRLKHDSDTRHIPIHVISAHENSRAGYSLGAMSCLGKPISKDSLDEALAIVQESMCTRLKRIVIATAEPGRFEEVNRVLAGEDVELVEASSGEDVFAVAGAASIDAIAIDAALPYQPAIPLVEEIQNRFASRVPPIIVFGHQKLTEAQETALRRLGRMSPIRRAASMERLLEESVLLLHRKEDRLSPQQRETLAEVRQTDPVLTGKTVLVIDFALTSLLEHHNLSVHYAENGRAGIELLRQRRNINAVLMDIMMPEMDGYETTRAIRQIPEFQTLPIIALTAKAMKGDRDKCFQAGASDYVSKPVEIEQLLSVIRVSVTHGGAAGLAGNPNPTELLADEELAPDDDRSQIRPGDNVLLIVEDDMPFARILSDLAHDRGMKVLLAMHGSAAIALARNFKPGAITLDVRLPDVSGWTLLDRLKHDPATRHIPVHVVSAHENGRRGFALGAMSYLDKPISKGTLEEAFSAIQQSMRSRVKTVLIVSADEGRRAEVRPTVAGPDLEFIDVSGLPEAREAVERGSVDGFLIDLTLPGDTAMELAEEIQTRFSPRVPPVIFFGRHQTTSAEAMDLRRLSRQSAIRHATSPGRLLEESVLLLHRKEEDLSAAQRATLAEVRQIDLMLEGRTVLVIDDDLRNIFALTSLLEHHNLNVLYAENGHTGIDLLRRNPDVDAVLMDIMMPGMDGYETTRAIREIPEFGELPIIALTAKAMKGDRDKCLQAGASGYVSKPVDIDHLLAVIRVAIVQQREGQRHTAIGA